MKPLLNRDQARAVADAIVLLSAAGARPTRVAIPVIDGYQVRIRIKGTHEITVFMIDDRHNIVATRQYACLERFVGAHAEAA